MTTGTMPGDDTAPRAGLRAAVADDLIEELTGWGPSERLRTFTRWHRGSLSIVQLMVVTILEASGPIPMTRLAEILDVSDASVTGIVDRMERRGLVERQRASIDRRVVLVALTDTGAAIFQEHSALRREKVGRIVDELSDEEAVGLLSGLRALRAAMIRVHQAADAAPTDAAGATDAADPAGATDAPGRAEARP